ncbi:MAG: DUF2683 family protein [Candidatus Aenigmarchaeota archaeon]|nr:DUF2683 family protein [Candidatus Aenigmarchaeota archaeon]
MVQAVVRLSEHANRILNIVKAKYDLRDKSEAIEKVTTEYEQEILEPELRPEFVASVKEAQKGKFKKIKNTSEIFR